jgi:hypothetical protein
MQRTRKNWKASGNNQWKIDDKVPCQGVHVDFEKKEIFFDGTKHWVVFESATKLNVYCMCGCEDQHKQLKPKT